MIRFMLSLLMPSPRRFPPPNPPTGPSHPMANCVHARANQIGPFELCRLLQRKGETERE